MSSGTTWPLPLQRAGCRARGPSPAWHQGPPSGRRRSVPAHGSTHHRPWASESTAAAAHGTDACATAAAELASLAALAASRRSCTSIAAGVTLVGRRQRAQSGAQQCAAGLSDVATASQRCGTSSAAQDPRVSWSPSCHVVWQLLFDSRRAGIALRRPFCARRWVAPTPAPFATHQHWRLDLGGISGGGRGGHLVGCGAKLRAAR